MDHTHKETYLHAHEGGHLHVHSAEHKKKIMNRISKAIGHLESIKRMVENDVDCSDVLIQLAAVRSAINSTGKEVLKNHMAECIVEAIEEGDHEAVDRLNKAVDMFVK